MFGPHGDRLLCAYILCDALSEAGEFSCGLNFCQWIYVKFELIAAVVCICYMHCFPVCNWNGWRRSHVADVIRQRISNTLIFQCKIDILLIRGNISNKLTCWYISSYSILYVGRATTVNWNTANRVRFHLSISCSLTLCLAPYYDLCQCDLDSNANEFNAWIANAQFMTSFRFTLIRNEKINLSHFIAETILLRDIRWFVLTTNQA